MFSKDKRRRLIVGCGIVLFLALGISYLERRGSSSAKQQSAPLVPAIQQSIQQTSTSSQPLVNSSAGNLTNSQKTPVPSAIAEFHQWAEAAAASGFSRADESKGLDLAKARASAMKSMIRTDPASALRQALPDALRASLPKPIAAAIEQPVKTTGFCSMRMMCNHSEDTPHGNCETTPVLLEDISSWNAYYGEQPWKSYLGQTVGFDGIAVDEELAVRSIIPVSPK